MKPLILALLTFVFVTGCQASPISPAAKLHPELRAKLQAITVSDGISETEADVIARSYFARHVGCGAYRGVHDGGDHWVIDAQFGYAGKLVKDFTIDKRTGAVVSPIGPSYDDPHEILR